MNAYTTIICSVLLGLAVSDKSLYDKESPVIQLNSKNFEAKVLKDEGLWLVEFYADWCGHCISLAPDYIKVASKFKGIFKIGAVNADVEKELAEKYQIQGYPTLKVFGSDKNKPTDLVSDRTADKIIIAMVKYVQDIAVPAKKKSSSGSNKKPEKDGDQYLLTTETFESFVKSSDKPVLVKFFAPWCGHCQRMAADFKSAASELKDLAYLAKVDATVETELAQKYQVQGFPSLKVFINNKGVIKIKDYTGGRTKEDIVGWIKSNVELPLPRIDLVQVTNQSVFEERCASKVFCVIAFLPPMEDSSEVKRLDMIKQLEAANLETTGVNWGWIWMEGDNQDELEHELDVDQLPYPIVVGVRPSKKLYGVLKTPFKQQNIIDFVKNLKYGKERISSYKTLPPVEETELWVASTPNKKVKDEL